MTTRRNAECAQLRDRGLAGMDGRSALGADAVDRTWRHGSRRGGATGKRSCAMSPASRTPTRCDHHRLRRRASRRVGSRAATIRGRALPCVAV